MHLCLLSCIFFVIGRLGRGQDPVVTQAQETKHQDEGGFVYATSHQPTATHRGK
eukprot:m.185148 g.185148  ORF g.185148 m.185148 type:complete len:54 (+) comp18110_c0_seq1:111-272(+)